MDVNGDVGDWFDINSIKSICTLVYASWLNNTDILLCSEKNSTESKIRSAPVLFTYILWHM